MESKTIYVLVRIDYTPNPNLEDDYIAYEQVTSDLINFQNSNEKIYTIDDVEVCGDEGGLLC